MKNATRKTKGRPDEIDIEAGRRLRIYRQMRNITQQQLSDGLGITFQQIQKYESGVNRMSAGRLFKISEFIGFHVKDFFPSNDEKGETVVDLRKRVAELEKVVKKISIIAGANEGSDHV